MDHNKLSGIILEHLYTPSPREQTPNEFVNKALQDYLSQEKQLFCSSDELIEKAFGILRALLKENYDLNQFRLQFFPATYQQTLDI